MSASWSRTAVRRAALDARSTRCGSACGCATASRPDAEGDRSMIELLEPRAGATLQERGRRRSRALAALGGRCGRRRRPAQWGGGPPRSGSRARSALAGSCSPAPGCRSGLQLAARRGPAQSCSRVAGGRIAGVEWPAPRCTAAGTCWACGSAARGYGRSTRSPMPISPRCRGGSRAAWTRWTRCSATRAPRAQPAARAAAADARAAGCRRRSWSPDRGSPIAFARRASLPGGVRAAHQRRLRHHAPEAQLARAPVGVPRRPLPEISGSARGPPNAPAGVYPLRARARAREVQRRPPDLPDGEDRVTAHHWVVQVRCFFADICSWADRGRSPFAALAPPAAPLERHDLRQRRLREGAPATGQTPAAGDLDLEREIPGSARWPPTLGTAPAQPTPPGTRGAHGPRKSTRSGTGRCSSCCCSRGLRIEEACELTTLDVLRRRPARRARLLPAARQAVEVRPRPRDPDRRRPRAA